MPSVQKHPFYRQHRWTYCALCQGAVVLCRMCGNNSCNGGRGEVDGSPCPECPESWKIAETISPRWMIKVPGVRLNPPLRKILKKCRKTMDIFNKMFGTGGQRHGSNLRMKDRRNREIDNRNERNRLKKVEARTFCLVTDTLKSISSPKVHKTMRHYRLLVNVHQS